MTVNEEEINIELSNIIGEYKTNLQTEINHRLKNWKFVKKDATLFNVVHGLLCRQSNITLDLINSGYVGWYDSIMPSILRTIIDLYICLSWILKDNSLERAEKYVKYGLGQEKLLMEHRIQEIKNNGGDPEKDCLVEASKAVINANIMDAFVNIELGSWSKITVRQMAEEAGCLDLYNLTYIPFSISAHNSWTHLFRFDVRLCNNPLHGTHFIGVVKEGDPDFFHYLDLITKYMKKTTSLFDENIAIKTPVPIDSYEILNSKLDELFQRLKNN